MASVRVPKPAARLWNNTVARRTGARGCEVSDRGPAGGVDLYALLGVRPEADTTEVSHAYRRRLREVHPDTRPPATAPGASTGDTRPRPEDAQADLQALQEAYLVLRDPLRRARYDAQWLTVEPHDHGGEEPPSASSRTRGVPVPVRVFARPFRTQSWFIRI